MVSVVVQVFRLQAQAAELTRQRMQGTSVVDLGVAVPRVLAMAPHVKYNLGDHDEDRRDSRKEEKRRNEEQPMTGLVVAENDFLKRKQIFDFRC